MSYIQNRTHEQSDLFKPVTLSSTTARYNLRVRLLFRPRSMWGCNFQWIIIIFTLLNYVKTNVFFFFTPLLKSLNFDQLTFVYKMCLKMSHEQKMTDSSLIQPQLNRCSYFDRSCNCPLCSYNSTSTRRLKILILYTVKHRVLTSVLNNHMRPKKKKKLYFANVPCERKI